MCRRLSNDTPLQNPTVHPLRLPLRAATSPYTGEAAPRRFLRIEFERAGHAAAPTPKNDSAYRPSSGRFAATFPQGKAPLKSTVPLHAEEFCAPHSLPLHVPPCVFHRNLLYYM